jgi:hypothetical protein
MSRYYAQTVEPLGKPTVARQLTATSSTQVTALTVGCQRFSMYASGADIRYEVSTNSAATADGATSHLIATGERLDLRCEPGSYIARIRDASTDGVLEITELA